MKKLLGFKELPTVIMAQILEVVEIWKKHMGDELVGVYLHGSIALNAFCPDSGDIISPKEDLEKLRIFLINEIKR